MTKSTLKPGGMLTKDGVGVDAGVGSVVGVGTGVDVGTGVGVGFGVGVSVGAGVITNPLYGADNIPLVVIPQVAYYGQNWFFDNGRLGYSFLQSKQHNVSFVSEINPESRFFIDWHPQNIFPFKTTRSKPVPF